MCPCTYKRIQCLNNQIFQLQQSQINDWEELFNRLTIFIMDCNGEQIRYAAQSFAELCHLFAEQLIKVVLTKVICRHLQPDLSLKGNLKVVLCQEDSFFHQLSQIMTTYFWGDLPELNIKNILVQKD